ncbi:MAG: peptide-methionine (R)-S-oxide reductase MsrB [Fimbriimonadaceae bacterium]|nr:peptide-methionine (R)-S-oxide reductase MsrB [Chitinophagales bacterium]
MKEKIKRTEEEWKKILTPEQYDVLRKKGTERPFTGKYDTFFEKGMYVCAGCGQELFASGSKFNSGCGWPAFDAPLEKESIDEKKDVSFGMHRVEILCSKCGGHLGHVFNDGPTETGERYCINSASIDFKDEQEKDIA